MKEYCWMICHPKMGVWFSPPASNAKDAWDNCRDWEMFMQGGRPVKEVIAEMKCEGWRAKRVEISS